MTRPWIIVGSGGHGREVADVLRTLNHEVLGFLDDDPAKQGIAVGEWCVLGGLSWIGDQTPHLSIALGIGSSASREAVVRRLKATQPRADFPPIVHPSALIGSRVRIGEGTLVQAGCILTCDIQVGAFVILNVGVGLSHDVRVDDFATLAPGSHLAGGVHCGSGAEIGMGTRVIQQKHLGERCMTGAGAVVIRDVPFGTTVVGVPAQAVRNPTQKED